MNEHTVIIITIIAYIILMAAVSVVSSKKITRASDLTVGGETQARGFRR